MPSTEERNAIDMLESLMEMNHEETIAAIANCDDEAKLDLLSGMVGKLEEAMESHSTQLTDMLNEKLATCNCYVEDGVILERTADGPKPVWFPQGNALTYQSEHGLISQEKADTMIESTDKLNAILEANEVPALPDVVSHDMKDQFWNGGDDTDKFGMTDMDLDDVLETGRCFINDHTDANRVLWLRNEHDDQVIPVWFPLGNRDVVLAEMGLC